MIKIKAFGNWGTSELGRNICRTLVQKCHNTSYTYLYTEYADPICSVSPSLQTPVVSWGEVRCHITHDYSSYIHRAGIIQYIQFIEFFRLHNETKYAVAATVVEHLILYKVLIVQYTLLF